MKTPKVIKDSKEYQTIYDDGGPKKNKSSYVKGTLYDKHPDAVEFVEGKYPKTAEEFKRLQREQYVLFCKKQMDYGPGNISVGTNLDNEDDVKLSLTGLWFRMNDKIQRLKTLLMSGQAANNEPLEDSFLDVSNYGLMAVIVKNKKWGK
jgi:hypothetical protein